MAFRFTKSITILPGLRVNLSKSGVSASVGRRGATVNLSSKGMRTTLGIPGTGMSWSQSTSWAPQKGGTAVNALIGIGEKLDGYAREFNALSPATNAASKAWNEAVRNFNTSGEPTAVRLASLNRSFDSTNRRYLDVAEEVHTLRSHVGAMASQLHGLRFGFFSGGHRRARSDLLTLVQEHLGAMQKLLAALDRIKLEVVADLAEAKRSLPSQ